VINEKLKRYVVDTINLLKQLARKAKKNAESPKEGIENYSQGVIMGYYSIITLLKHQAFIFCIDQNELGLADIKSDIDLLGLHRNSGVDFGEDNWSIEVMTEEKVKGYLRDTIKLLKDQEREAKKDVNNPKEGFEDYNKGAVMAYCSVFSLLKHQAILFKVDEKELGLADIIL